MDQYHEYYDNDVILKYTSVVVLSTSRTSWQYPMEQYGCEQQKERYMYVPTIVGFSLSVWPNLSSRLDMGNLE
jgi:hypothetical protein